MSKPLAYDGDYITIEASNKKKRRIDPRMYLILESCAALSPIMS